MITYDQFRDLMIQAHDRASDLPPETDVVDLLNTGAQAAATISEPLGTAVAAVLALAAHEEQASHARSVLSQRMALISLAIATKEYAAAIRKSS